MFIRLLIVSILGLLLTSCVTATQVNKDYLNGVKDTADVEVLLSSDMRNFNEKLYLRGEAKCNKGTLAKLTGKKTSEEPASLVAKRNTVNKDDLFVKIKLPANKPIPLRYARQQVTDTYFTDFVVYLDANKTYTISYYKKLTIKEKASQMPPVFLPNDYFHKKLNCQ